MKTISFFSLVIVSLFYSGCRGKDSHDNSGSVIANGQMPGLVKDNSNDLYLVYGNEDSLMYTYSKDQGKSFSLPSLITVLPHLAASHTRGPQIAVSDNGLTVIACNESGDIFSFNKNQEGGWSQTVRVNDVDTVAKEGLMALGGDGKNVFAAWLDLRNGHNQIYSSGSVDGGKTWSKNSLIYASPDIAVCECCKPSVAVKGDNVYVMFRNWLNGNRDMYLITSADGGSNFGTAQKLGNGSWALEGCPMDGGNLAVNKNGHPETVWLRQKKIYACEPGAGEKEIGEGRSCTIESINGRNVYAWTEHGEIVVMNSQNIKRSIGKGGSPQLKAISDKQVICVWENEKQIHSAVLEL